MWESRVFGEIPKDLWKGWEARCWLSRLSIRSVISTALFHEILSRKAGVDCHARSLAGMRSGQRMLKRVSAATNPVPASSFGNEPRILMILRSDMLNGIYKRAGRRVVVQPFYICIPSTERGAELRAPIISRKVTAALAPIFRPEPASGLLATACSRRVG